MTSDLSELSCTASIRYTDANRDIHDDRTLRGALPVRSCNFLSTLEVTIFLQLFAGNFLMVGLQLPVNVFREHRTLSEFKYVAGGPKNPPHYYQLTFIGQGLLPTHLCLETAARISWRRNPEAAGGQGLRRRRRHRIPCLACANRSTGSLVSSLNGERRPSQR